MYIKVPVWAFPSIVYVQRRVSKWLTYVLSCCNCLWCVYSSTKYTDKTHVYLMIQDTGFSKRLYLVSFQFQQRNSFFLSVIAPCACPSSCQWSNKLGRGGRKWLHLQTTNWKVEATVRQLGGSLFVRILSEHSQAMPHQLIVGNRAVLQCITIGNAHWGAIQPTHVTATQYCGWTVRHRVPFCLLHLPLK